MVHGNIQERCYTIWFKILGDGSVFIKKLPGSVRSPPIPMRIRPRFQPDLCSSSEFAFLSRCDKIDDVKERFSCWNTASKPKSFDGLLSDESEECSLVFSLFFVRFILGLLEPFFL